MKVTDSKFFSYSGRIIQTHDSAFLGFTNSKVEFFAKGDETVNPLIEITFETQLNGNENNARLKVLVDERSISNNIFILEKQVNHFLFNIPNDGKSHKITIIKITEAAMSHAKFTQLHITNGELIPFPYEVDKRFKVEFIGDSITCGYGVYGEPDSPYNISEEDGTVTYAALAADALNLNARYFSVSGYGMYLKYDGDLDGVIPKVYPYTNYFIDSDQLYDFNEFVPDLYVINLGTNDSGHLDNFENQRHFIETYRTFIKYLKSKSSNAKILCILGTLCTNVFPFVEEAIQNVINEDYKDIYALELPYHDVETDGMASGHPSLATHKKDADRLIKKIIEILEL